MLRLIWLFEIILIIIEEKDKNTLTYQESVPWPSLMEVFLGHQTQNWKSNPPAWPLQSVPMSSMILTEIVCLQPENRRTKTRTCQALHHLRFPR